jgi:hypothetical protein
MEQEPPESQKSSNEKNISTTIGNRIRDVFLEFCDDSTIHGPKNMAKSSNHIALRIFWAMCTAACTAYCIYSCVQIFQNYNSWPTTTKITLAKEIPTQFPKVSFCNLKSLDCGTNDTLDFINQTEISDEFDARLEMGNSNLTIAQKKKLGFSIDDMLVSCKFNMQECNSSVFTYFYSETYGNCYTFNSGYNSNGSNQSILTSSSSGSNFGLQLIIYLGDPSVDMYRTYDAGLVVSIDNQSIVPFTKGDKIQLSARANTDLIVDRNFITKQPAPYGDCLSDTSRSSTFSSQYFDYIVKAKGQNYSQEYCFSLCVQQQTIKYCGCANFYLPVFTNSSTLYCKTTVQLDCMNNVVINYGSNFTSDCTSACPFECFSIDFTVRSHFSLFPNTNEATILYDWAKNNGQTIGQTEVQEAYLSFNVYYRNIQFTRTEENVLLQQADLMSNFGGTRIIFS